MTELRICYYCSRADSPELYVQLPDDHWRCKSRRACRRRIRGQQWRRERRERDAQS